MIYLLCFALIQTVYSQCSFTAAETDPVAASTCTSDMSETCENSAAWTACAAAKNAPDCIEVDDPDDTYCVWLEDGWGDGYCVLNDVSTCDVLNCFSQVLSCHGLDTDQGACEAASSVDESAVLTLGGDFDYFDFDECYACEDNADGDTVCDYTSRNNDDGTDWMFCSVNQRDLTNQNPCSSTITGNAVCNGEKSCQGLTLKGSSYCTGDNSCFESKFKPQLSTDTVICSGPEACRDARGHKRSDIDDDDLDVGVYFCMPNWWDDDNSKRQCEGADLSDNTACMGEETCKEAKINADYVYCNDDSACKEANINADELLCDTPDACKATYATIDVRMDCVGQDACDEAEITLSNEGQVFCGGSSSGGACENALTKFKVGVFNGNHSTQCQVAHACAGADIKTQSLCLADDSCHSANIYHDVMCVTEESCENTYISQGSICCGPGCATANTREEDEKGGEGCSEGDIDDDDDYGECNRCGKETLLGWATANKTNIGITIAVVVIVLLMVLAAIGFVLKKIGILGGGGASTEEVEE